MKELEIRPKIWEVQMDELTAEERSLVELAQEGTNRSYSPYSHFHVGAALLTREGKIYKGCNIENSSYGATNCAERTAISKAISEGHSKFVRIVIAAKTEEPCVPCGMCRQFMKEFSPDMEVICLNTRGDSSVYKLEDLLPYGFDNHFLKRH